MKQKSTGLAVAISLMMLASSAAAQDWPAPKWPHGYDEERWGPFEWATFGESALRWDYEDNYELVRVLYLGSSVAFPEQDVAGLPPALDINGDPLWYRADFHTCFTNTCLWGVSDVHDEDLTPPEGEGMESLVWLFEIPEHPSPNALGIFSRKQDGADPEEAPVEMWIRLRRM